MSEFCRDFFKWDLKWGNPFISTGEIVRTTRSPAGLVVVLYHVSAYNSFHRIGSMKYFLDT
jgi:hypothetical protein